MAAAAADDDDDNDDNDVTTERMCPWCKTAEQQSCSER